MVRVMSVKVTDSESFIYRNGETHLLICLVDLLRWKHTGIKVHQFLVKAEIPPLQDFIGFSVPNTE